MNNKIPPPIVTLVFGLAIYFSKPLFPDFSNVILLMTSNLGATDAEGLKIGFGDQTKLKAVDKAVEKFFSPEFRNRLDATIQFNKLF